MVWPASLSGLGTWVKDNPLLLLAVLGILALGIRVSLEPERLDALEVRVTTLEGRSSLLEGIARVTCLKNDSLTLMAAGLPCDSLLRRR